jgi:hypothetical protein
LLLHSTVEGILKLPSAVDNRQQSAKSGHSVSSRNKGSSVTGRVEKTVHGKLGGHLEKPRELNSQAMLPQ